LIRRFLLLVALALPLTLVPGSAHAVPGQMTWIDSGQRSGGMITFTAASPLCLSGTVRDIGGTTGIKMEHTCADGSGTFEFEVVGTGRFHFQRCRHGPVFDPSRDGLVQRHPERRWHLHAELPRAR
jgi:hypothetical protein